MDSLEGPPAASPRPRVRYLLSPALISASNALPSNVGRSQMVHSLAYHMDLLEIDGEVSPEKHDADLSQGPEPAEDTTKGLSLSELLGGIDLGAHTPFETHKDRNDVLIRQFENLDRTKLNRAVVIEPEFARTEALQAFHSATYLDVLLAQKEDQRSIDDEACGLVDDCYRFPELADHVKAIAGASISAARCLTTDIADIAIHWDGGRHHAHKSRAAGFCYVNDVVLAILELRKPRKVVVQQVEEMPSEMEVAADSSSGSSNGPSAPLGFGSRPEDIIRALVNSNGKASKRGAPSSSQPAKKRRTMMTRLERIFYLDLDLHWGDGVEEAFNGSSSVLTLSIHNQAPGFYPVAPDLLAQPTDLEGDETDQSLNIGNAHTLSLPLQPGAGPETWSRVWRSCVEPVMSAYEPAAIVVQCGLDGLAGDPMKQWNLDLKSILSSIECVLSYARRHPGVKVLLLGGGGYSSTNAARGWAAITALVLGRFVLEGPMRTSSGPSRAEREMHDDAKLDHMADSSKVSQDDKSITDPIDKFEGGQQNDSRAEADVKSGAAMLEVLHGLPAQSTGATTQCTSTSTGAYTLHSPIPDTTPDWPLYGAAATLDVPATDSLDLHNDQIYLTKVERYFQHKILVLEEEKRERHSRAGRSG